MDYTRRYGLEIRAWCLMTNHVHPSAVPAEQPPEAVATLRSRTMTGRPCGTAGLPDGLETMLGRNLKPRRPGRPGTSDK